MDLDVICASSLRLIRGVLIGQNWSATTLRCKMPNVRCNVICPSEKWTNWNLPLVLSDNFWGKSSSTNFPIYVCFLHQWKYRIKIVDVCPVLKVSVTSFMTRAISVKLSAEMWLMIILKVTKNKGFTLSVKGAFSEKPQWGVKLNSAQPI